MLREPEARISPTRIVTRDALIGIAKALRIAEREVISRGVAELKLLINKGGLRECTIRGLLYVGMARGNVDERGAQALRQFRLAMKDSLRGERWSPNVGGRVGREILHAGLRKDCPSSGVP
jgi:hypothetical protein